MGKLNSQSLLKASEIIKDNLECGMRSIQLVTKILEDNSTLLQVEVPDSIEKSFIAPQANLISIIAIQPSVDFNDASNHLLYISSLSGVEVIRQVFPILTKKQKENGLNGLMLLVKIKKPFTIHSDKALHYFIKKARKDFLRNRSTTFSLLEASGYKATLITGKNLIEVHYHGKRIAKGVTVFQGHKGFHSKLIEPFLKLDRVPSRFIQDYPVQDLPVHHAIGTRIDNDTIPVGFPRLSRGSILINGSSNTELILVLQQLIFSLSQDRLLGQIFVIDTKNELNGLINHIQGTPNKPKRLQIFSLGTNFYLNLCDVIIPIGPHEKISQDKAVGKAWKAHLISQFILSSLDTSEYLISRYSVPLESQIRKSANQTTFTLNEVKLSFTNDSNNEATETIYTDMMSIEALEGILEQFRSFKEINYSFFKDHYQKKLTTSKTISFFQFGSQPQLIKRATIFFLLDFLSKTLENSCIVLTHADEFLSRRTSYQRSREIVTSNLMRACEEIISKNILLISSSSLQSISSSLDSFEEINNLVYLRMINSQDREMLMKNHQFLFRTSTSINTQQQWLGVMEGEGLLFRFDAPQNNAYHFKLQSDIPINTSPFKINPIKPWGSSTLGLPSTKFESLMNLLNALIQSPMPQSQVLNYLGNLGDPEDVLKTFQDNGLFSRNYQTGNQFLAISNYGHDYYNEQLTKIAELPPPLSQNDILSVSQMFKQLENEYNFLESAAKTEKTLFKLKELNIKVKNLIGSTLNYLRCLKQQAIPWRSFADYTDLCTITGIEYMDFQSLFELANTILNNLMVQIDRERKKLTEIEIKESLRTSSLQFPMRSLADHLPSNEFIHLKNISKELNLPEYPTTGILDIFYELHLQNRSLFDEVEKKGY